MSRRPIDPSPGLEPGCLPRRSAGAFAEQLRGLSGAPPRAPVRGPPPHRPLRLAASAQRPPTAPAGRAPGEPPSSLHLPPQGKEPKPARLPAAPLVPAASSAAPGAPGRRHVPAGSPLEAPPAAPPARLARSALGDDVDARDPRPGSPPDDAQSPCAAAPAVAGTMPALADARTCAALTQAAAGDGHLSARVAALAQRVELFLRSGVPALQLTLAGQLGARVALERRGVGRVAVALTGTRGPLPSALVEQLRGALRARGLAVVSLTSR